MSNQEQTLPRVASRVVFFLGAGASRFANIPTTVEFAREFEGQLSPEDKGPVSHVLAKLKSVTGAQGIESPEVDIEALMEALEKLSHPSEEVLLNFCTDSSVKPDFNHDWPRLLGELRHFVRRKCQAQIDNITYLYPIADFVRAEFDEGVIDVFTTNYDNCIEQMCRAQRLVCRDGFDPYWNPRDFDKPDTNIRLYKIHGSIDWLETENGEFAKSVMEIGEEENRLLSGEAADPLVLYPMRKWQYKEPLLENLLTLKRKLSSPDCKTVVVVGYSFRDDYIRDVFWDAARTNRELVVIVVDPYSYDTYQKRLKWYSRSRRTRSSLCGRVVCLPFAVETCLGRLMLDYTDALWGARVRLAQCEREAIHKPDSVDWTQVLTQFARCMHVEEVDRLLEERIGIKPALIESKDSASISARWGMLRFWSIAPRNFLEALALRALAYEQFGLDLEKRIGCYDIIFFASEIRRSRLRYEISPAEIRLVEGEPIRVAPDLLAPFDFKDFTEQLRTLELRTLDLAIHGGHFTGFSTRYGNFTNRVISRLKDYFDFWKDAMTLEEYGEAQGRDSAEYRDRLALLRDAGAPGRPKEQELLADLKKTIGAIDSGKFEALVDEITKFILDDTKMKSTEFKTKFRRK